MTTFQVCGLRGKRYFAFRARDRAHAADRVRAVIRRFPHVLPKRSRLEESCSNQDLHPRWWEAIAYIYKETISVVWMPDAESAAAQLPRLARDGTGAADDPRHGARRPGA